jgi:hypothetical protein
MINRDYRTNWYLDKLIAGYYYYDKQKVVRHRFDGIPIGKSSEGEGDVVNYYLYNHFTFFVDLNEIETGKYLIVGFSIMPSSIEQSAKPACDREAANYLNEFVNKKQTLTSTLKEKPKDVEFINNKNSDKKSFQPFDVLFTYDVIYKKSSNTFTSRWDHYKHTTGDRIHWYNLISSILIILMFSIVILYIFCRALKKDIEIYNTVYN